MNRYGSNRENSLLLVALYLPSERAFTRQELFITKLLSYKYFSLVPRFISSLDFSRAWVIRMVLAGEWTGKVDFSPGWSHDLQESMPCGFKTFNRRDFVNLFQGFKAVSFFISGHSVNGVRFTR